MVAELLGIAHLGVKAEVVNSLLPQEVRYADADCMPG